MGMESATITQDNDVRQRAVPRQTEQTEKVPIYNKSFNPDEAFSLGFNTAIRVAILQAKKYNGPTSNLVNLLTMLLAQE